MIKSVGIMTELTRNRLAGPSYRKEFTMGDLLAAIAALLFSKIANWCFAVPPVIALLARISAGSATPAAGAASGS